MKSPLESSRQNEGNGLLSMDRKEDNLAVNKEVIRKQFDNDLDELDKEFYVIKDDKMKSAIMEVPEN